MTITKNQRVSLKIISLFIVAILSTFIGDNLHSFFGDWKCSGSGERLLDEWIYAKCNYGDLGSHESTWHWGYRHWLYFTMCIILFLIQINNIFFTTNQEN